jgi:hypothetical protein
VSVVPLRTLLSFWLLSGLSKVSSLGFPNRRLLLSTGRSIRCFRGVSVSLAVAVLGTRNESSASCEEAVCRAARFDVFGTNIESSSSCDELYRSVAFRGLIRVDRVSDGVIKMVGSFGLGLRRRAIFTVGK